MIIGYLNFTSSNKRKRKEKEEEILWRNNINFHKHGLHFLCFSMWLFLLLVLLVSTYKFVLRKMHEPKQSFFTTLIRNTCHLFLIRAHIHTHIKVAQNILQEHIKVNIRRRKFYSHSVLLNKLGLPLRS